MLCGRFPQVVVIAVAWVSLAWEGGVSAGLPHPDSWRHLSDDGRYLFVMLSPLPIEEDVDDRFPERESEIRLIRSTYSKSGLYMNDGSTNPLWEYAGEYRSGPVMIAPDGDHLVFIGGWTFDEYVPRVVDFTRRGQLIRSYSDSEVIPQYALKFLLNGRTSPTCYSATFDAEQMTYIVQTNQNERFVFDVVSGEIIEISSPFPMLNAAAGLVLLTAIAMSISLGRRNRRMAAD